MKMEVECFSEKLLSAYKIILRHNPEDYKWKPQNS
jgi:hypothetical protein